ncbi:MAG: hypothetical protein ACD_61C00007G0002 [uncultured bacterium]|nr:MAG: hypothetical protein ACD_61C00007G0002 [uncultured bacterium]
MANKSLQDALKHVSNKYPEDLFVLGKKQNISKTASFVIPTFNSSRTLHEVVKSIINQTVSHQIKEIVLINDASSDQTEPIIEELSVFSPIPIIYVRNRYRKYSAACRNKGVRMATGDVICFIDSDIVLPPNYLDEHLSIHSFLDQCVTISYRCFTNKTKFSVEDFPAGFAKGDFRCDKQNQGSISDNSKDLRLLGYGQRIGLSLPEMCLTCSICYSREDLLKVKGAPENFVGWGLNDTSMAAKVISLGRFVIPIKRATVYHINHPDRSGSLKLSEYQINYARYRKMLLLPREKTFKYRIQVLG